MNISTIRDAIASPVFRGYGYREGVDFDEGVCYDRRSAWVEGTHVLTESMPECPRARWDAVADQVFAELDRRLAAADMPPGERGPKHTLLARLLALELCPLVWALAGPNEPADVLADWLALRPEERWYMAARGHEGKHWRRAWTIGLGSRR